MRECLKQQGICFAIIKFVNDQSVFLLKATDLIDYWDQQQIGGRKSIPRKTIEKIGVAVPYQINPLLPYLRAVDSIIE